MFTKNALQKTIFVVVTIIPLTACATQVVQTSAPNSIPVTGSTPAKPITLDVGAQYTGVRKFMGRRMESVIQYTTYKPKKKVVFKSISDSSPLVQTFLFEPTAGGTRLTTRLEMETSGLMGLAQPLIASSLKREVDANFAILKDMLETRVPAASV